MDSQFKRDIMKLYDCNKLTTKTLQSADTLPS